VCVDRGRNGRKAYVSYPLALLDAAGGTRIYEPYFADDSDLFKGKIFVVLYDVKLGENETRWVAWEAKFYPNERLDGAEKYQVSARQIPEQCVMLCEKTRIRSFHSLRCDAGCRVAWSSGQ